MSEESLRAFARKAQLDKGLNEKLMDACASAVVKVAADVGFTFTVEEARALIDEVSAGLSDEQLEAVAGGLIGMPFPFRTEREPYRP
jgi:predicted ribosomally synthesized peptide with nif11-like leader